MQAIETILNVPFIQMLGIILLIGLAEKIGIPIIGTFVNIFNKKNGNGNKDHGFEEYARAKLEDMCERIDEIRADLRDHIKDENGKSIKNEEWKSEIKNRLFVIEQKMK